MAEETSNILKELEKAVEAQKLKVGIKSVLRALKQGTASKVFYSNNTPEKMKEDITHYAQIANITAVQFEGNSKDFGVACKRTHNVLAAVILKA